MHSPFTNITYRLSFLLPSLDQFLRAIWGADSWTVVLILPQIKLHSQLSCFAFFSQQILLYLTLPPPKSSLNCAVRMTFPEYSKRKAMKDSKRKLVFFPHCCLPQLQLLLTRQGFSSLWTISSRLPPPASRNNPSISCLENSWHSKPKSQFRHSLHYAPNFNLFQHVAHMAHGPPDCELGNDRNFPIHPCSASTSPSRVKGPQRGLSKTTVKNMSEENKGDD